MIRSIRVSVWGLGFGFVLIWIRFVSIGCCLVWSGLALALDCIESGFFALIYMYHLGKQIDTQLNTQVNTQVDMQVNTQVNTQVDTQVNTQVDTQVLNYAIMKSIK